MKQMDSKQRNIVRKAQKAGVTIEQYTATEALAHLREFQQLRSETQQRAIDHNRQASMLLKSDKFFADILTNYDSTLYLAVVNQQTAAVALMLHSGKTTYYYSGGSNHELNRQTGASAYLIHYAMCDAAARGQHWFDMGGVPVNPEATHPAYGVYKFKQSYGGEYMEARNGSFVINKLKYTFLNQIKKHRRLLRLMSKTI